MLRRFVILIQFFDIPMKYNIVLIGLLFNGIDHILMPVTYVANADARDKIDVLVTIVIP